MTLIALHSGLFEESLPLQERIGRVLIAAACPPCLLHLFACDCAERAIWYDELLMERPFPYWRSAGALATKRLWVEALVSDEEMIDARDDADFENLYQIPSHSSWGSVAAASAAGLSASSAALQASEECIRVCQYAEGAAQVRHRPFRYSEALGLEQREIRVETELRWQMQRLAALLLGMIEARQGFFALLFKRQRSLQEAQDSWRRTAEEALFST